METEVMQKLAAYKFQTPDGSIVDVVYCTSDGGIFFSEDEAHQIADLGDGIVTPVYRDKHVRDMAKTSKALAQIVGATDWLKAHKVTKKEPSYVAYVEFCEKHKYIAVPETMYDFIQSKVYATELVRPGQKDSIFTWAYGMVNATLLRRYPQGQVWQLGDNLIFTCPTNTELMSGTYQQIFKPLLDKTNIDG